MGVFTLFFRCINVLVDFYIITLERFENVIKPNRSALAFENSEIISPNDRERTPEPQVINGNKLKRLKLLIDINISPGGSPHVFQVSTKNVMDVTTPTMGAKAISSVVDYSLWITETMKNALLYVKYEVLAEETLDENNDDDIRHSSPILQHGFRKTISPKRRVSKYKKLLPEFSFGLLNSFSKECVLELPNAQQKETETGNTSLNNSKSQIVEKRKRHEEIDSDDDDASVSSDEEENGSKTPRPTGQEGIDEDKTPKTEDTSEDADDEQISSADVSIVQRLQNIDEEDYQSAEDPDFDPKNVSSSSSSDEDAELDDGSKPEFERELQGLREEGLEHAFENIFESADLEENEELAKERQSEDPTPAAVPEVHNNGVPQEDNEEYCNEPEYTNGQVSSRELFSRNPQFRHFYGSETEASSPFSVNPSEPSVPNTPVHYPSDSSHNDSLE